MERYDDLARFQVRIVRIGRIFQIIVIDDFDLAVGGLGYALDPINKAFGHDDAAARILPAGCGIAVQINIERLTRGNDIGAHGFKIPFFAVVHITSARLIDAGDRNECRIRRIGVIRNSRSFENFVKIIVHIIVRDVLPGVHVCRITLPAARDFCIHICVRAEVVQKGRIERKPLFAVARTSAARDFQNVFQSPGRARVVVPAAQSLRSEIADPALCGDFGEEGVGDERQPVVGHFTAVADAISLEVVVIFVEVAPASRSDDAVVVERIAHPAFGTVDRASAGERHRRARRHERIVNKYDSLIGFVSGDACNLFPENGDFVQFLVRSVGGIDFRTGVEDAAVPYFQIEIGGGGFCVFLKFRLRRIAQYEVGISDATGNGRGKFRIGVADIEGTAEE